MRHHHHYNQYHVDRQAHLVEPEERHHEPDISEGQVVATEVSLGGEQLFKTIERFVELGYRFFIGELRLREAGAIHAILRRNSVNHE